MQAAEVEEDEIQRDGDAIPLPIEPIEHASTISHDILQSSPIYLPGPPVKMVASAKAAADAREAAMRENLTKSMLKSTSGRKSIKSVSNLVSDDKDAISGSSGTFEQKTASKCTSRSVATKGMGGIHISSDFKYESIYAIESFEEPGEQGDLQQHRKQTIDNIILDNMQSTSALEFPEDDDTEQNSGTQIDGYGDEYESQPLRDPSPQGKTGNFVCESSCHILLEPVLRMLSDTATEVNGSRQDSEDKTAGHSLTESKYLGSDDICPRVSTDSCDAHRHSSASGTSSSPKNDAIAEADMDEYTDEWAANSNTGERKEASGKRRKGVTLVEILTSPFLDAVSLLSTSLDSHSDGGRTSSGIAKQKESKYVVETIDPELKRRMAEQYYSPQQREERRRRRQLKQGVSGGHGSQVGQDDSTDIGSSVFSKGAW